jgi:putative OPT family oligopeptide transporter
VAVALIIFDQIQEKRGSDVRFPVLAVAVGVYLPLGLSVPIFIGGLIAHIIKKKSANMNVEDKQHKEAGGLLLASGLITGEALMGVLVAIAAVSFQNMVPYITTFDAAGWCGFVVFVAVTYYVYTKIQRS